MMDRNSYGLGPETQTGGRFSRIPPKVRYAGLFFGALGAVALTAYFRGETHVAAQSSTQSQEVKACETLRRHGDSGARACYERLSRSTDLLTRAEGLWGIKNYQASQDAFVAAAKAKKNDPYVLVRFASMYLDHFQPNDASDFFNQALKLDPKYAPALLGMARVLSENYSGRADEFAAKALESDPKLYEAHEVLARIALEDNNPKKATEEAKKALDISPEALEALAILATIDLLDDKTDTPWLQQMLKINPNYGEGYALAGHFFVNNRRYAEGIELYRTALKRQPDLLIAKIELGINLMRFGQEEEAYNTLKAAWESGYVNEATRNTLKLMDSYKNYETFKTPTTVLRLHKREATLLKPYFQAEFDRALQTYEKKYKYKLTGPVQIEVYPDHEDFAVRTMGVPGLGALGVTFGQMVAMDSPSGRKPGDFHWASTMWHELSHVYVLAMTNHRTPRWFTEGVAVYEETAASPDWGDRLDHPSIQAIKDHKLLPIAELDRGYIHPTYPEQVIVSYFQGGRVISYIVEKWGYDKVLAMIKAFGDKKDTPEVIKQELGLTPEEFDKQFFPWLEAQTKKTVEGFDDWAKKVKALNGAAKEKQWDQVITEGTAIRDIYPDYVEAGSVYEFLAEAYTAKNDKANAMAQLEAYSKVGGRNPGTLKKLADMQTEAGKKREAAATLERLNLIYLSDEAAHQKLGDLYVDLNNSPLAIREFQTVLAGKPVDPAQAHFQLARALQMAKRTDEAREEVYAALEVAPNFKPAQKLLLELGAN
jgi:cellulose synthase operon protein C